MGDGMNNINRRALTALLSAALVLALSGCSREDKTAAPPSPLARAGEKASTAVFVEPAGVATDGVGNVYVADSGDNTIRKITPAGMVTTFAGRAGEKGHANGTGAAASFNAPAGIAADAAGNIFVADNGNGAIRQITPAGVVTDVALAGVVPCIATGGGLLTDSGRVYVCNPGGKPIEKLHPEIPLTILTVDSEYAGGCAIDGAGNVYIAETSRNTIRMATPGGGSETFTGSPGLEGGEDGRRNSALFRQPAGLATDGAGNLYVADTGNHTIRKSTPEGVVTTLAGVAGDKGFADGAGTAARFNAPKNIAIDRAGNLYVTDNNKAVRKITPDGGVTTIAGTPPS